MMSSYGLKVNGKIFAMFGRGKFVAKLSRERVDQLRERRQGRALRPGPGKADEGVGRLGGMHSPSFATSGKFLLLSGRSVWAISLKRC